MLLRDDVLKQALALPPADQAYVALALEDHLVAQIADETDEGDGLSDSELLSELQQRSANYRAGLTTARDAADVLADLRKRQADETAP